MNCTQIRELLPELAAGMGVDTAQAEISQHVATCSECSTHLREWQKTMALLEEWQAPEPSPYFETRMQARLREEMARPAAGWFRWMRPAWRSAMSSAMTLSMAGLLLAGALVVGNRSYFEETASISTTPPSVGLPVQPGTAVGDLQALANNDELYADFDVLDDLQVQDDVTANP